MKKFKLVKFITEDNYIIEDIIQIVQYLDGWVVLTKDGSVFMNAKISK